MTTSETIRPHSPFRTFWILFFLTPVVLLVAGVLYLASFFFVSGETRVLRNAVLDGNSAFFERVVEMNSGRASVAAAKFAAGFIDDIPPEAHQMMAAFKKGDAAVYRVKRTFTGDRHEILRNTDMAMERRGWYRVVGVSEPETLVAIYVKEQSSDPDKVQVCVTVMDRENMVCASAEGDLKPLFELLQEKTREGFLKDLARN